MVELNQQHLGKIEYDGDNGEYNGIYLVYTGVHLR
jgi:hypothetical protein